MTRKKRGGWFGEPKRHALAAKGIKTAKKAERNIRIRGVKMKQPSNSLSTTTGWRCGSVKKIGKVGRIEIYDIDGVVSVKIGKEEEALGGVMAQKLAFLLLKPGADFDNKHTEHTGG